jgi:hypothetical protein
MYPASVREIEALSRICGMKILKIEESPDLQKREGVRWTALAVRAPDHGTRAAALDASSFG